MPATAEIFVRRDAFGYWSAATRDQRAACVFPRACKDLLQLV
jgi:hypothetical protein